MIEKIFALMLFATALVSCGGSGSNDDGSQGPDFVTISVASGTPYTYTETVNASSPVSYDPYIWSTSTGTTETHMYIHTYDGSNTCTPRMEIYFKGTMSGSYFILDGNRVDYMPAGGPNYYCDDFVPGTSGTITITRVGPSGGGQIQGNFNLLCAVGTSSTTALLEGTFRITRN